MSQVSELRSKAETEASRFPPLLARAEHLAGAVLLGDHGRRRAGLGDDFWQYRPAEQGDSRRMIDHRRSARGDTQFVREREWQIAQSVMLWIDRGASMRFSSDAALPTKGADSVCDAVNAGFQRSEHVIQITLAHVGRKECQIKMDRCSDPRTA